MTNQTKVQKLKKSFLIHGDAFIKLKIYSAQKNIPYGVILEALADSYVSDPNSFPKIDFQKYR